ncbi:MAG: SOS response-associated peptidase [Fimbriimonadaceae bacterium]|nr:SOS response-associated peptidase [Fimbriimonadaceae bacterium]
MCARYGFVPMRDRLLDLFGVDGAWPELPVIAPTNDVPAVFESDGSRILSFLRWGLVPRWSDDPKETGHINARSETVFERSVFREAARKRRCLLPATSFFEWGGEKSARQAYRFSLLDGGTFAFAGIWEEATKNRKDATCALLTVGPNELVSPIHDRMPVILRPDAYGVWLDGSLDSPDALGSVLTPYPASAMKRTTATREETLPPKAPPRLSQGSLFDL